MELKTIPLSAIEPDKKNPRKDFGDVKALAETFRFNSLNPGEPVNPIVTVRDGEVYRIVDGERRYRAMKSIKQETCHAVVCESMDEANVMVSMLTTDDKQRLTELERSQGVQQMLLLGVSPEKVEKVGRLGRGGGKRLNKAMILAGDKADQMTIDHLMAVEEFKGDQEAVDRMTAASSDNYRQVASDIRAERERRAKVKALEEACAAAGIEIAEDAPASSDGYSYRACCGDPEAIAEAYAKQPDGSLVWLCETAWGGPEARFYAPRIKEEDPEEAALKERIADLKSAIEVAEDLQLEWYAERIDDPASSPSTDKLMIRRFFGCGGYTGNERREKATHVLGIEDEEALPDGSMGGWIAAWVFNDGYATLSVATNEIVRGTSRGWAEGRIVLWVEQLGAMEMDGYALGEADRAVLEAIDAFSAAAEVDEEEPEEEEEEQWQ